MLIIEKIWRIKLAWVDIRCNADNNSWYCSVWGFRCANISQLSLFGSPFFGPWWVLANRRLIYHSLPNKDLAFNRSFALVWLLLKAWADWPGEDGVKVRVYYETVPITVCHSSSSIAVLAASTSSVAHTCWYTMYDVITRMLSSLQLGQKPPLSSL